MIIVKKLFLNGKQVKIVSDSVVLDLTAPGRAIFSVISETAESGSLTEYHVGTDGTAALWFSGYAESCRRIDRQQVRLVVREYSAILARRWPLAQRNTSARRVLGELNSKTGIAFRLGVSSTSWADTPIAYFINTGNGYEILDLIGKHLKIKDYVWLNQPDGSVFIGSGSELAGADKILVFPESFFTNLSGTGADCPCLPALRPGRRLRIGNTEAVRIETITLQGEMMRLGFQC